MGKRTRSSDTIVPPCAASMAVASTPPTAADGPRAPDGPRPRRGTLPQPPTPLSDVAMTSEVCRRQAALKSTVPKIPPNKVGTLELYKRFPQEYDLLMSRHDGTHLSRVVVGIAMDAQRRCGGVPLRVADLGCGTGRILCALLRAATQPQQHPIQAPLGGDSTVQAPSPLLLLHLLCGYDKEAPMLSVAAANLNAIWKAASDEASKTAARTATGMVFLDRAEECAPPLALSAAPSVCLRPFDFSHVKDGALLPPHPTLHVVVCAWSLSYVMRSCWGGDRWHQVLKETVNAMMNAVVDNGVVVIVETLGNGCTEPTRRNTMLEYLEEQFGFTRQWVRTDYQFASVEEGAAMCKFFFAQGVAESYAARGALVLPECTGIWTKVVQRNEGGAEGQK